MHALEPAEAALFLNAEVFALKRSTTQKLYTAFEALRLRLKDTGDTLQFSFPNEVLAISAKISQGENFKGCPWVMLDYHRYFKGNDMFAFRVMAWFGHYFSAHLIVGGRYLKAHGEQLMNNCKGNNIYFATHNDPWEHAIEAPFFQPLENVSADQIAGHIRTNDFIKLSIVIQTTDIREMEDRVLDFYRLCWGGN